MPKQHNAPRERGEGTKRDAGQHQPQSSTSATTAAEAAEDALQEAIANGRRTGSHKDFALAERLKALGASYADAKLVMLRYAQAFSDTHGSDTEADALSMLTIVYGASAPSLNGKRPLPEGPQDGGFNSLNSLFLVLPEASETARTPPELLGAAAYHGLAGEIIHAVEGETEADPAGMLVELLTLFGALVGRATHFRVSGTRHYPNLFINLVGNTSKSRKGTSWGAVRYVFKLMQGEVADWLSSNIVGGLSSGEGLIHAVADARDGEKALPTQTDKRVLVYESEFASVLKMPAREGNTLSEALRLAWDGEPLQTLTKGSPERAEDAHIALVGNITREEVTRHLSETDRANGLGNRFLWLYVKRARTLPEGGAFDDEKLRPLAARLQAALDFARAFDAQHVMTRDPQARAVWAAEYERLSEGYPGMFGAMTARAEAQVMRLAMLYALLDQSQVIQVAHLQAALEVWRYAEDSVRFIFGAILGDPLADKLVRAVRAHPEEGLSDTELFQVAGHNVKAEVKNRALALCVEQRLLRVVEHNDTGGRPERRWLPVMGAERRN